MLLVEPARAKINLTLKVLGRRADGYHALESVVSFASVGDTVSLEAGTETGVVTGGAFAKAIDGPNLLERALTLSHEAQPRLVLGQARLTKSLPVAAGLGGGSADAAALLRLIARANPELAAHVDWMALAARLGADVPVCLRNAPALMWGIGERLAALPAVAKRPPVIPAVLVNPRLPLSTAAVFRSLAASPAPDPLPPPRIPQLRSVQDVADLMRADGNDLEPVAERLLPAITNIKRALSARPGCLAVALSGSGPTCFALFAHTVAAEQAATHIAKSEPGWWVVGTEIEFPADL
jgi:4-diphosphocytidyl-2-C-methyl-D-erythritol kinase